MSSISSLVVEPLNPEGKVRAALTLAEQRDSRRLPLLQVSCVQGCDSCCRVPKVIPFLEAMVRVEDLLERGGLNLPSDMKAWEVRAREDLKAIPGLVLLAKKPCFFLKDSSCSIYENRPSLCRTLFVTSPAQNCDPHNMGHGMEVIATPASDSLVPLLVDMGRNLGLKFPTLPLSTAYYLAYLTVTQRLSVGAINRTVASLLEVAARQ